MYDWSQFIYSALATCQRLYRLCAIPGFRFSLIYWSLSPSQKEEKKAIFFVTSQYKHSFSFEVSSWLRYVLVVFWRNYHLAKKKALKSTIKKTMAVCSIWIQQKQKRNKFQSAMGKKRTISNAALAGERSRGNTWIQQQRTVAGKQNSETFAD